MNCVDNSHPACKKYKLGQIHLSNILKKSVSQYLTLSCTLGDNGVWLSLVLPTACPLHSLSVGLYALRTACPFDSLSVRLSVLRTACLFDRLYVAVSPLDCLPAGLPVRSTVCPFDCQLSGLPVCSTVWYVAQSLHWTVCPQNYPFVRLSVCSTVCSIIFLFNCLTVHVPAVRLPIPLSIRLNVFLLDMFFGVHTRDNVNYVNLPVCLSARLNQ